MMHVIIGENLHDADYVERFRKKASTRFASEFANGRHPAPPN